MIEVPFDDFLSYEEIAVEDWDDDFTVVTENGYFRHNRSYYESGEYCLQR